MWNFSFDVTIAGTLRSKVGRALGLAGLALAVGAGSAQAADHADTPFLIENNRPDARITDLHAFEREGNLLIAVSMDPTIPTGIREYVFPSDLRIEISIDNRADVVADPFHPLGGVIHDDNINARIRYEVTFRDDGSARINAKGRKAPRPTAVFIGLRDDPFIRTPRAGRNVASVVIQIPIDDVLEDQSTLLIWATSTIDGSGQVDLAGRAVRNQFGRVDQNGNSENCLNMVEPKHHRHFCHQEPDVIVYDTDYPALFPNGRDLPDDVDQMATDQPLFENPGEVDTVNDVPFLPVFPYLADPH